MKSTSKVVAGIVNNASCDRRVAEVLAKIYHVGYRSVNQPISIV